jgi:hypothetical protein
LRGSTKNGPWGRCSNTELKNPHEVKPLALSFWLVDYAPIRRQSDGHTWIRSGKKRRQKSNGF